jgi:membrane-associated HD superfamily phosphohydrolase
VSTGLRLIWLLVISGGSAALGAVSDYQVGDKAAADIITPVQMVVVDEERTEALRQQEAQRVPPIFLWNTNVAAETEVKMLTAYTAAKEGFLKSVERAYKTRTLDGEAVAQERFGKLIGTYQKQNRSFPLTTNIAALWALGESDQPILEDLATTLRETLRAWIRVDTLSANARLGPSQVRLISIGSMAQFTSDLDAALAQSVPFYKSNFVSVTQSRKNLQAKFGPETQWAAKFLAGFVRENCVCDENVTWQQRARRTDPILTADTYEAGAVVAKAGTLIDRKIKAALDELARRTEAETVKAQAAEQRRGAEMVAVQLRRDASEANAQKQRTEQRYVGMLVVLSSGFIGLGGIWLITRRRQSPASELPVLAGANAQVAVPAADADARLLPDFRSWIRRHFVRRLLQSNVALTEIQRQALLRVGDLERRLEDIKGPLQDKLMAYEERITELEHELKTKGAENRELLKATIKMARERLEAQRAREGVGWN